MAYKVLSRAHTEHDLHILPHTACCTVSRQTHRFRHFDIGLRERCFLLSFHRLDHDFVQLVNLARCHTNLLLRVRFGRECLILIAEIAYNQFCATGCIERKLPVAIGDGAKDSTLKPERPNVSILAHGGSVPCDNSIAEHLAVAEMILTAVLQKEL